MPIADKIAYVLSVKCDGLSTNATATALGLDLRPAAGARYRYVAADLRVEYDSLGTPQEQRENVQRAIVYYLLDTLGEKIPRDMSSTELVRAVFNSLKPQTRRTAARLHVATRG